MAISTETFVALETALTKKLVGGLSVVTGDLYAAIQTAIDAQDFIEARKLVDSINFDTLYADHEKYITYMTNMAMLFGASRVTPNPGTSVVGLGHEAAMTQQAVQSFGVMIGRNAEDALKQTAMQLIALAETDARVQKADAPERVVRDFATFMNDQGKAHFNLVSSLHTSRVSAYGFTAEADAMGYDRYQINEQLDNRICEVCRHMHGMSFPVREAKSLLEIALRAKDPADLKHIQPWPSQAKEDVAAMRQMTEEELIAKNWHIPPFHPGCRGLLSRTGKAPSLAQLDEGTTEVDYQASEEDFVAMSVKVNQTQLSKWNTYAGMSPAEVVARLKGSNLTDFMAGLLGKDNPTDIADYTGLTSMKIGQTTGIKILSPIFGGTKSVSQTITFAESAKRAVIQGLDVGGAQLESDLVGKYLKNVVGIARDMNFDAVVIGAGTAMEEVAAAQAGFLPTPSGWKTLAKQLLKKTKGNPLWSKMAQADQNAIVDALTSTDPKGIRALLKAPEGLLLLSGSKWVAELSLIDPESMGMFLKYVKAV